MDGREKAQGAAGTPAPAGDHHALETDRATPKPFGANGRLGLRFRFAQSKSTRYNAGNLAPVSTVRAATCTLERRACVRRPKSVTHAAGTRQPRRPWP